MLKKINLRVRFLALKIAFFRGFENDNILSSKSCIFFDINHILDMV